jgi:hypothetical protein
VVRQGLGDRFQGLVGIEAKVQELTPNT